MFLKTKSKKTCCCLLNYKFSLCWSISRVVQSPLSMPWPIMCSVSLQLGACMELAMFPLLTMLPTPRLWRLCRRTRQWRLQRTAATQATPCLKPFLQRPSSCLSMTSIRHIDCARIYSSIVVCAILEGCHLNLCFFMQIIGKQTMKHDCVCMFHLLMSLSHMPALMLHACKLTTLEHWELFL